MRKALFDIFDRRPPLEQRIPEERWPLSEQDIDRMAEDDERYSEARKPIPFPVNPHD